MPNHHRRVAHVLVGVGAAALLSAAAVRTPERLAVVSGGPTLDLSTPHCSTPIESSPADSTFLATSGQRFAQPLAALSVISEADLDVNTTDYASALFQIVAWDPNTLAPDPTTIAFRTRHFYVSSLSQGGPRVSFDPPIVLQSHPDVAEVPSATVAIDYTLRNDVYFSGTSQTMLWSPDGAPDVPGALEFQAGTFVPLNGAHPVLSHSICGGGGTTGSFMVFQSVVRTDTIVGATTGTLAQRFRVPAPLQLRWVELALAPTSFIAYQQTLGVFDAEGASTPPTSTLGALALANYQNPEFASWGTHFAFDTNPLLLPNHDYWLLVSTSVDNRVYARTLTGAEGPDFTAGIGDFWTQAPGGIWSLDPRHALDFKIVGDPYATIDVAGSGPATRNGLQLSAEPNPSRGAARIRWAGARGTVRIEVFDPSGRRIGGDAFEAASGQWSWRMGAGHAAGAGLYFVRAVDAEGHTASLRLGLLR